MIPSVIQGEKKSTLFIAPKKKERLTATSKQFIKSKSSKIHSNASLRQTGAAPASIPQQLPLSDGEASQLSNENLNEQNAAQETVYHELEYISEQRDEEIVAHEPQQAEPQDELLTEPQRAQPANDNLLNPTQTSVQENEIVLAESNTTPAEPDTENLDEESNEIAADNQIESEAVEEIPDGPPVIRNPSQNPAFTGVVSNVDTQSSNQTEHEPAENLSANAQAAAPTATNEQASIAQANQVEEMSQQEPQEFSAETFKAMLMARIAEMQLPENNEEADEFDEHNNIAEVNQAAVGDVNQESANAAGPIEQSTAQPPDTAAVPEREIVDLQPPNPGLQPKAVGAKVAVPNNRPESEISKPLQDEAARMDDSMSANNITDDQWARSEEPTFQEGLSQKTTAKTTTAESAVSLRNSESGILTKSGGQSDKKSAAELQAMNTQRGAAVNEVAQNQNTTATKDTTERERIAGEINGIYELAKTDVTKILDDLEAEVTNKFTAGAARAKKAFENYVAEKMRKYKSDRYSGILGGGRWLKDLFAGLPNEVNQFFVDGRVLFVSVMDEEITKIATHVATELNRATERIQKGKQDVKIYVEELPTNLKKFGTEAAEEIQEKFDSLQDDVNSKQEELVDTLAQEYVAALEEVDASIEEMKAANKGLIDAVMDTINGIIETIQKLRQLISDLLSAIQSAVDVIMDDPIGFMGRLFNGIGQGIELFKANIQKHLLGGLIEWLTGALGPMGITLPEDIFSLKGIFSLVMQVLGLSWDYLRTKAVKLMGEPVVKVLETGFEMFQLFVTKGVDGIWEYLKESFNDLKETVIESIKSMLITQVIEAGIKWLVSLLIPGAGFIKAIMAIKDVVVFFVESAIMLIPAIIEGILALAAGSIAGVAKAIEFGLSKLLPLIINLFAKLIGLGGLSKKVMKIFTMIRKRVDKAIDKLLKKASQAGRKLLAKMGLGKKKKNGKKDDQTKKLEDTEVGEKVNFNGGGESHKIYFKKKGKKQELIMESVPEVMQLKIKDWESQAKNHAKKVELVKLINKIKTATTSSEAQATTVSDLFNDANKDLKIGVKAEKADNELEDKENALKKDIIEILTLLGVTKNPIMDFLDDKKKAATVENGVIKITTAFKAIVDSQQDYSVDVNGVISRASGKTNELPKLSINKQGTLIIGTDTNSEHGEYKPIIISQKFVDKGLELKYEYEGEQGQGKEYTTLIEFGTEAAPKEYAVTSSSNQLVLKEAGTRGRTDSSGKIMTEDFKKIIATAQNEATEKKDVEIHSAHLIADWFRGSGFAGAQNIIPTSKNFNTKKMFSIEKQIAERALEQPKPFNLSVRAVQKMVSDNAILTAVKKEGVKNEKNQTVSFANVKLDKLLTFLNKEKDPQYTESVNYDTALNISDRKLEADTELKKWFKIN